MVIAAKTGQGKTLTFALPILDLLVKKIHRFEAKQESEDEEEGEDEQFEGAQSKPKKQVFDSV